MSGDFVCRHRLHRFRRKRESRFWRQNFQPALPTCPAGQRSFPVVHDPDPVRHLHHPADDCKIEVSTT